MRNPGWAIAAALLACCGAARADERGCDVHDDKTEARLCSYEPTTIGFTWDNDDVRFMDFKISVRYQVFPESITKGLNYFSDDLGNRYSLYIAFTGRFGQYIGTRESAPVIGKRFNPKMFLRRWSDMAEPDPDRRGYLDFAYGHESNGQSVSTPGQYAQAQAAAERADFANDQLSRGWDYLELVWKKILWAKAVELDSARKDREELSSYLTLKYFLPSGLLQSTPEEYNGLENSPQGKPRSQVNGVAGLLKYHLPTNEKWNLRDFKIAAGYETGYHRMFRYNTYRLELGTKVVQLPMSFWYQTGYGSDLAQYYKKVSSKGIEVQIGSF